MAEAETCPQTPTISFKAYAAKKLSKRTLTDISSPHQNHETEPAPTEQPAQSSCPVPSGANSCATTSMSVHILNRSHWSRPRLRCFSMVNSTWFELLSGIVITINLVVVILQTDRKAACRWTEAPEDCAPESAGMQAANIILLVLYCSESGLRIYVYRWYYFRKYGNILDCMVILAGILGEVLGGLFSAVEILRLLRIVRLLRGIRILSVFRELYLIIHGLLSTLKAIFWAAVLMFVLLTMWSILSVELLDPINYELTKNGIHKLCRRCPRSLRTVMDANLTFFQTLVVGDGWDNYFIPIIQEKPITMFIFVAAFFSIALGVMNLILAVIVDSAADAREADIKHQIKEKEERRNDARRQLAHLCSELDFDHDGTLSLPELKDAFDQCTEFRQSLQLLDVDKSDLDCVFKIMDKDKSGDVSYAEFAELLYQVKAQNSRMILMLIKLYSMDIREAVHEELGLVKASMDHLAADFRPRSPAVVVSSVKNPRDAVVLDVSSSSAHPEQSKLEGGNSHKTSVERTDKMESGEVSTIVVAEGSGAERSKSEKSGLRITVESDTAWSAPSAAPMRLPGMLDTSLETLETIPGHDESFDSIPGHERHELLLAPGRQELLQHCRRLQEDATRTMGTAIREHTTALTKVEALLMAVNKLVDSVTIGSAASDACDGVFADAPLALRETSLVATAPPATPEAHISSPLHDPPVLPLGVPTPTARISSPLHEPPALPLAVPMPTAIVTSVKEPGRDDRQLVISAAELEEATRLQLQGMERLEQQLRHQRLEECRLAVARHRELMKVLHESKHSPDVGDSLLRSIDGDEADPENWC